MPLRNDIREASVKICHAPFRVNRSSFVNVRFIRDRDSFDCFRFRGTFFRCVSSVKWPRSTPSTPLFVSLNAERCWPIRGERFRLSRHVNRPGTREITLLFVSLMLFFTASTGQTISHRGNCRHFRGKRVTDSYIGCCKLSPLVLVRLASLP